MKNENNASPKTLSLDWKDGKFVLTGVDSQTRLKLAKDAYWVAQWKSESSSDGTSRFVITYETVNLKAAAAFRRHASRMVEKIFLRAFQCHYDLPWDMPPLPELDPHQREGLEWALRRKRSYLAHAPGAGKTAQAILAGCFAQGSGQSVFIVPPSLTYNWAKEVEKVAEWAGAWPWYAVVPRTEDRDQMDWAADFIICPDSMLTKGWVYERLSRMQIQVLAVDEASRFKEWNSERSLALYGGVSGEKKYKGLFQDARHVIFLDGSPMPNRPMELWAPTYALHPQAIDCRDRDDFGYRYCGAKPNERGQWEYLYSSNEEELREKLQADFMHVVTEDQLSHPERRRSMLFMNLDARSSKQKSWERKHLTRLKMSELDEETSQGDMARFRRELGVRKAPWVARYVADRLEEKNESILLFAWHREVCEELWDALGKFNPGLIMGGVPKAQRERYFDEFQRKKRKLLILNIDAGGRGHNLQSADRVIFAEYSWTDELNKQCEKRASRRGSERDFVRCEYIVSPGSMDEVVLNSLFAKERRVKKVITGGVIG